MTGQTKGHKMTRLTAAAALAAVMLTAPAAHAADKAPATPDKAAVEQIVHDYLLDHPEVIVDAIRKYREQQQAAEDQKAQVLLQAHRDILLNDPGTPVGGNPKGDVTIVEFFDYHCGYCKKVFPAIQELIKSDGNIRYVYKELPILGAESVFATRVALAGWQTDPKKYEKLRNAMMATHGALPQERVFRLAKEAGYDTAALKKAMASPEVQARIDGNYKLAETLNIRGTPAFIIGNELVPGAVDIDTLKELVAKARKG